MKIDRRAAGATVLAALAGLAAGPALAQHGGHGMHAGEAQPTDAQRAELHRQIVALLGVTLAHTDFDAVGKHFAGLIAAHAGEIGGDTSLLQAHVKDFVGHLAEAGRTDPQGAAAHMAHALMQLHAPRG